MKKNYTEKQGHGLKFEEFVIDKLNLIKSPKVEGENNYTNLWDAYMKDGTPVSIKYIKRDVSDICLADIFRQSSKTIKCFVLIVGFWEKKKSNLKEIYMMKIDGDFWRSFFNYDCIEMMERMMKTSGRGYYHSEEDKKVWKKHRKYIKKRWVQRTGNVISPRFRWVKPENKENRGGHRIQCAIRQVNFQKFFIGNKNVPQRRYINVEKSYHEFIGFKEEIVKERFDKTLNKSSEDIKKSNNYNIFSLAGVNMNVNNTNSYDYGR